MAYDDVIRVEGCPVIGNRNPFSGGRLAGNRHIRAGNLERRFQVNGAADTEDDCCIAPARAFAQ
ncbi:hypothetical protein D3C77_782210 [compost metagenome]